MKKMLSLIWISSLIALTAFSCSTNDQLADSSDLGGEEALSLEKEFGGFTTGNEAVAFGDTELLSDSPEDEDVTDSYASDVAVVDALSFDTEDTTAVKAYFLRITYGLLEGDSTATDVIDWSGMAEVNKGTLVVLKTIRFEGNDFIHLPRTSRQSVEFTSQTKPHFDGMLLAIIDNDSTDQEGTFSFTAGAYSRTLTFSELDSLELLEQVGDKGHEVSLLSRSKEYVPFAGGFISGRWIRKNRHGGEFRGRWINSLGTNAGHVRGIWGVNRGNRKVFKGKYINFSGEFRGLIAGVWGYERDEKIGFMRGHWVNRDRDVVGVIRGKFKAGEPGDRRGFFHARYRVEHKNNAEETD